MFTHFKNAPWNMFPTPQKVDSICCLTLDMNWKISGNFWPTLYLNSMSHDSEVCLHSELPVNHLSVPLFCCTSWNCLLEVNILGFFNSREPFKTSGVQSGSVDRAHHRSPLLRRPWMLQWTLADWPTLCTEHTFISSICSLIFLIFWEFFLGGWNKKQFKKTKQTSEQGQEKLLCKTSLICKK